MEYISIDDEGLTYEQFMDVVTTKDIKAEYSNGDIFFMSPTSPNHNRVQNTIYSILDDIIAGCYGCEVFSSDIAIKFEDLKNEYQFEPDVMVFCDDKFDKSIYKGTPKLLVEIMSRATKDRDLGLKLELYEKFGVEEYWIVDIGLKEVTIYSDNIKGRYFQKRIYQYGDMIPWNNCRISTDEIFSKIK